MLIAKKSFSAFFAENKDHVLDLCLHEGFVFSVRESKQCITVRCVSPSGHVRFAIFEDHRTVNLHGGKPHVCNQWYKDAGDPVSFMTGKEVTDTLRLQSVLQATAIMCLTQTEAYNNMKVIIFS